MIFKTTGNRIEIEYEREVAFFVRLPLLGELLWTHGDGWQHWPGANVKASLKTAR